MNSKPSFTSLGNILRTTRQESYKSDGLGFEGSPIERQRVSATVHPYVLPTSANAASAHGKWLPRKQGSVFFNRNLRVVTDFNVDPRLCCTYLFLKLIINIKGRPLFLLLLEILGFVFFANLQDHVFFSESSAVLYRLLSLSMHIHYLSCFARALGMGKDKHCTERQCIVHVVLITNFSYPLSHSLSHSFPFLSSHSLHTPPSICSIHLYTTPTPFSPLLRTSYRFLVSLKNTTFSPSFLLYKKAKNC